MTTDPTVAALKLRDGLMLTAFGKALFVGPLKWLVILAPLALVFLLSHSIERMRPATAQLVFWIYAALVGVSLASIFMVFTHTSIVRVFFITAASFGALSLWGYTTQRDLSGMGSFLLMGLFGIILAGLVNLFMASSVLHFAISVIGVVVFAGLTAWDTQRLKNEYSTARWTAKPRSAPRSSARCRSISTSSTCSRCCCNCSASATNSNPAIFACKTCRRLLVTISI